MKLITKLTTGLLLTITSLCAGELKIDWTSPDDFRDADSYYNGGKKSKDLVLKNLEKYFTRQAKTRIPEGSVLEMTVNELDLAGDFEPWLSPNMQDVRIVKEIYPARIHFDYRLLDSDGNVISEGSEKLKDYMVPNSLSSQFLGRSQSYPYVKTLVKDWMRKLGKSKK